MTSAGLLKSLISHHDRPVFSRYFCVRIFIPMFTPSLLNTLTLYSSSIAILNSISSEHRFNNFSVELTSFTLYSIISSILSSSRNLLKSPLNSRTLGYCIVTCISFNPTRNFCEYNIVSISNESYHT